MARGVTLITGASAGLGAEFARQCAARGETLALVARRRDRMEALAEALGGEVHVFEADLAKDGRRRQPDRRACRRKASPSTRSSTMPASASPASSTRSRSTASPG